MKSLLFILITTSIMLVFVQGTVAEMCPKTDLTVLTLDLPSEVTAGDEFSCTITVQNDGSGTSEKTPIHIGLLPDGWTTDLPDSVPPLEPGKSTTMTIPITIPTDISGMSYLKVIPGSESITQECINMDNSEGKFTRILPEGTTVKAYTKGTNKAKYYKATNKVIAKTNRR